MIVVYADPEMYAGWPANHGAWQWGSEWLVGFLRGKYVRGQMHNVRPPFDYCFARSLDEGETWSVESHGQEFEAQTVIHAAPAFDMKSSIRRVCGVYDHGGDHADERGGFFLSENRGRDWRGPYLFTGLGDVFNGTEISNTSRQCELPNRGLIFLSSATRHHWGSDLVFVAEHDGKRFNFVSTIKVTSGRSVMPAVAELGDRIVVVTRRRHFERDSCWIDSFVSDDDGRTWSEAAEVATTGGSNGNPPALIESGGKLYCAYGDRGAGLICYRTSADGVEWSTEHIVAHGEMSASGYFDLGYPRLLRRADGTVVAFFYIATDEHPQQHIAMAECK